MWSGDRRRAPPPANLGAAPLCSPRRGGGAQTKRSAGMALAVAHAHRVAPRDISGAAKLAIIGSVIAARIASVTNLELHSNGIQDVTDALWQRIGGGGLHALDLLLSAVLH